MEIKLISKLKYPTASQKVKTYGNSHVYYSLIIHYAATTENID